MASLNQFVSSIVATWTHEVIPAAAKIALGLYHSDALLNLLISETKQKFRHALLQSEPDAVASLPLKASLPTDMKITPI